MIKSKTIYVCEKCDAQFPKWQGRCTECGGWGTLQEQTAVSSRGKSSTAVASSGMLETLTAVRTQAKKRLPTGLQEFDRVIGGGIVPGGLILVGGDPGIGKSTLILQIGGFIAGQGREVFYVSGEESSHQVRDRFIRLGLTSDRLKFLGETNISTVIATIREHRPQLVIIDSIQTIFSDEIDGDPGSVSQVRTVTGRLAEAAKELDIPIIIIGHVTKLGNVAGPRTLEHLVDVVLYLEGDRHHLFRILRAVKNRFGSTGEIGVFDMQPRGLREVNNPSEIFLSERKSANAGSVITAIVEGSRAFLVEIQALVSRTNFGYPQRRSAGFDLNRLQLLVAVLTKKAGLFLGSQDIHINVAGGFRVSEPAVDLAVCLAIASASRNKPISQKTVVFGEVGLAGEVRNVSQTEKRFTEIKKMGFTDVVIPIFKGETPGQLKVSPVESIQQAVREIL